MKLSDIDIIIKTKNLYEALSKAREELQRYPFNVVVGCTDGTVRSGRPIMHETYNGAMRKAIDNVLETQLNECKTKLMMFGVDDFGH